VLVLTWNLFHGRSVPDTPRELLDEFAARLASWEWDVALLQEVPPWWPPRLGQACAASAHAAPTSRNWFLPLSRWAARRRPDIIKSWGGGANAMLVRGERVVEHRARTLRRWPERRVVHGVRLQRGWWVCNLHAQAHSEARAQADVALAARSAIAWSGGAPVVLGGDLNTRVPVAPDFTPVAAHGVDHVLVRSLRAGGEMTTLARGQLSDHAPVLASVEEGSARGGVIG
jgi:endonuclease/exonuclease/phosphatase family metal-dependent hydrolase